MNPVDDSDLYDVLSFNGVTSPGIVSLSGHDRAQKVDIKDADGSGGATTTHKGEKPCVFQATFQLCVDLDAGVDDYIEWEVFRSVLRGFEDGKKAADIYHPDLATNLITQVTVSKVSGMVHDGKGGSKVTVEFTEFRPPKPKANTPKPSQTNADAKKEIDNLLDEFNKP